MLAYAFFRNFSGNAWMNFFLGYDFKLAYLDRILIACSSTEDHMIHLIQLFERLNEFGIIVNTEKCVLGASQDEFLWYMMNLQSPDQKKWNR